MIKKLFLFIFCLIFLIGLVSSDLGISNPNLPKLDFKPKIISFNNNTAYVNNSDHLDGMSSEEFWQTLNAQAGLTGDKTGSFNLFTTGNLTAYNGTFENDVSVGVDANVGGDAVVGGTINLSDTTGAGVGVINVGGNRFFHNYGDSGAADQNLFLGTNAGNFVMVGAKQNLGIGVESLDALTIGDENVGIGYRTLTECTEGFLNLAIGTSSLRQLVNGNNNIGVGREVFSAVTSGSNNIGFGRNAGLLIGSTSHDNIVIGTLALDAATGTPDNNIIIGNGVLGVAPAVGNRNVIIGYTAASSTASLGTRNILIGNDCAKDETGSDILMIDSRDRTSQALGRTGAIIYGNMDATPANQKLTFNADVTVSEDLNVSKNFTGNQIYGSMFNHEDNMTIVSFATQDIYVNVTNMSIGSAGVNGFTYDSSNGGISLTTQIAGVYDASWGISFNGQTGSTHGASIAVNDVKYDDCYSQRKLGSADTGYFGKPCQIRLAINDKITLVIADEDAGLNNVNVVTASVTLTRIGH